MAKGSMTWDELSPRQQEQVLEELYNEEMDAEITTVYNNLELQERSIYDDDDNFPGSYETRQNIRSYLLSRPFIVTALQAAALEKAQAQTYISNKTKYRTVYED